MIFQTISAEFPSAESAFSSFTSIAEMCAIGKFGSHECFPLGGVVFGTRRIIEYCRAPEGRELEWVRVAVEIGRTHTVTIQFGTKRASLVKMVKDFVPAGVEWKVCPEDMYPSGANPGPRWKNPEPLVI